MLRFDSSVLGTVVVDTHVVVWNPVSVLERISRAVTGIFVLCPFPNLLMPSSKENQKPVDQKSMGGISVAIYANQVKGRDAPLYKVATKRTYVRNGEYVTVTSLFRDDLPVVQHLHRWAWIRIYELQREWRQQHGAKADSSQEEAEAAEDVAE